MKKILSILLLLSSLLSPIAVLADEVTPPITETPSVESTNIPDNIPIYYGKNEEGNTLITIEVAPNLAGGCIFSESALNEIESTQTTSENIPCAIWSLNGEPILKSPNDGAGVDYVFLNARYYEGSRGQFISQDPMFWNFDNYSWLMDPQGQNSYSYARNNPVNLSDPSGNNAAAIALEFQGFGIGMEAIGLGADATIFGAPAGLVIGAAGLVAITIGGVIMLVDDSSQKYTPGSDFSSETKNKIDAENKAKNDDKLKCDNCGKEVKQPEKPEKGKTPSPDEKNYDHKTPKKVGGDNSPDNGSIKCRNCNLKKGAQTEEQFKNNPNNPINQKNGVVYSFINPFIFLHNWNNR